MQKNTIQVEKEHYDFNKYVDLSRRNSYYHQINEVAKCRWKSVLLIWVGDWIVVDILRKIGKEVTTFDFDKSLSPDIVWDVTKIDEIVTKKYDIVVCCQVLEHIPFEMFENTIKRMQKITDLLVLSLPNRNTRINLWMFLPIIWNIIFKFNFRMFRPKTWDLNKDWCWEHYREVDTTKQFLQKKISNILDKYFNISATFTDFCDVNRTFRILNKKLFILYFLLWN